MIEPRYPSLPPTQAHLQLWSVATDRLIFREASIADSFSFCIDVYRHRLRSFELGLFSRWQKFPSQFNLTLFILRHRACLLYCFPGRIRCQGSREWRDSNRNKMQGWRYFGGRKDHHQQVAETRSEQEDSNGGSEHRHCELHYYFLIPISLSETFPSTVAGQNSRILFPG